MIYTLTFNPAVDHTIYVNEIHQKDVTRVRKTLRDAAGKGINVSKVLRILNQDSLCLGFIAGDNGEFIVNELEKRQMSIDFIKVSGNTRENMKIFVKDSAKVLQINEVGPIILSTQMQILFSKLDKMLQKDDILVLSGSVPKGVESTIYKKIIRRYNDVFTILDTAGELFEHALESSPNLVIPNIHELEEYMNTTLDDDESAIDASRVLLNKGVKHVIVTLSEKGAIYVSKDKVFRIKVPLVDAMNTVGAGDSFVAGFIYGMTHDFEMKKTLQYAGAVACASVLTDRTAEVNPEDIDRLFELVEVSEV